MEISENYKEEQLEQEGESKQDKQTKQVPENELSENELSDKREDKKEAEEEKKAWLFKENIRLEAKEEELKSLEETLLKEKKQFQAEAEEMQRFLAYEKKRLQQNESFFEKKMDILKNGFAQLDAERRCFEREKMTFEAQKSAHESYQRQEKNLDMAELLFQGVKSQLALKKRYKDLIKMFHPDNIAGDHEMVLMVNSVYEKLKREYEVGKQA